MEYFTFERPTGAVTCADPECPCPKEPLGPTDGFLFISNQVVRARSEASGDGNGAVPIVVCREAARRRDLDLEVAAEDTARWRDSGQVALRATPRRELKFKEFLGSSIEDAERVARAALGDGLLGTDTVRNVATKSSTAQGRTAEEALATVQGRVPKEAIDPQPAKIIQEGATGEIQVHEYAEFDARKAWRPHAPRGAQLDELTCTEPPKKGVLGVGKREGTWTVKWSAPFIAEIEYTMPAVVLARYFPR